MKEVTTRSMCIVGNSKVVVLFLSSTPSDLFIKFFGKVCNHFKCTNSAKFYQKKQSEAVDENHHSISKNVVRSKKIVY